MFVVVWLKVEKGRDFSGAQEFSLLPHQNTISPNWGENGREKGGKNIWTKMPTSQASQSTMQCVHVGLCLCFFLIELFIFYYFYDKIELFTMNTFCVSFFFFFLRTFVFCCFGGWLTISFLLFWLLRHKSLYFLFFFFVILFFLFFFLVFVLIYFFFLMKCPFIYNFLIKI